MFSIFMMGKNYSRVHSTHIILCTLNLRTRLKLSILRQECKKYEYNYIIHQNSAQVREECTLLCIYSTLTNSIAHTHYYSQFTVILELTKTLTLDKIFVLFSGQGRDPLKINPGSGLGIGIEKSRGIRDGIGTYDSLCNISQKGLD